MKQKMLLLKSIKIKIVKKKHKGVADFITALFAMMALIIVLFLAVYTVGDLYRLQKVDQIARRGILKLETKGKLSSEEITGIKTDLKDQLGATFDETNGDGVYAKYKKGSEWDNIPAEGVPYGTEVGIYIQCKVNTTKISSDKFSILNPNMTKENTHTIKRMKTSISKAPTKN